MPLATFIEFLNVGSGDREGLNGLTVFKTLSCYKTWKINAPFLSENVVQVQPVIITTINRITDFMELLFPHYFQIVSSWNIGTHTHTHMHQWFAKSFNIILFPFHIPLDCINACLKAKKEEMVCLPGLERKLKSQSTMEWGGGSPLGSLGNPLTPPPQIWLNIIFPLRISDRKHALLCHRRSLLAFWL